MTGNNFELHSAFRFPRAIWLGGFSGVPETYIIGRCAANVKQLTNIHNGSTHQAMCRPSGKAATQETTPELRGLRNVFKSLGVPFGPDRPSNRTSQTSTAWLRLPA